MKRILEYLASDAAFLYEDFGCRIADSKYDSAFGGTGSVTLENNAVQIRLWLERDRLFLDMRGLGRRRPKAWYSMDILMELVTGTAIDDAAMNIENTGLLKEHFSELLERFSTDKLAETESKCKELEKRRSARLFG